MCQGAKGPHSMRTEASLSCRSEAQVTDNGLPLASEVGGEGQASRTEPLTWGN